MKKPVKKTVRKKKKIDNADALLELIIEAMQEKKAKDIVTLNLKGIEKSVCDYYVICHAESNTQVEAIAKNVDGLVKKKLGEDPWHTEGFQNAEWILLDYVNIVVHVMQKEFRDFYGIERLWADAEVKRIED